jgi:F420-non-reducing hydrogenase small subunit
MERPKIALYWCSSCGGCEESVLDVSEDVLKIIELADIVFWPVALDAKYEDVEGMKDGEIAACLINGSIRMDEQEYVAKLLRKKSRIVIAHGSCAHIGGIYGLSNFYKREECLNRTYKEVPSVKNPEGILPQTQSKDGEFEIELSGFYDSVKPLNHVIEVDYYIPGCPPNPKYIFEAVMSVLQNRDIPKGSVFADQKALCATCSRRDTKPEKAVIKEIKRLHEWQWDPEECFLAQDMICLGPATRGGCGERCIKANMPCRGCYGPTENVIDQGGKFLSALASIIDSKDEREIEKIADSILDMGGLFYRYCMPSSLLGEKIKSLSLEDAELFISQGKYAEAMDIYTRLISADHNNVYLLQRIEELKTFLKLLGKDKTN